MPTSCFIRRALLLCAMVPLAACNDDPTGADSDVDEILGCERISSIGFPGSATGSLATSDCMLDDGSYADFYSFRVSGSRQVTITMRSNQLDSFLLLLSSSGSLIDADDDSGDTSTFNGDAQIVTTLSSGTYVIAANSFDLGETGSYSIRVD